MPVHVQLLLARHNIKWHKSSQADQQRYSVTIDVNYRVAYILRLHRAQSLISAQPAAIMITYILWEISFFQLPSDVQKGSAYFYIALDKFKVIHHVGVTSRMLAEGDRPD